MKSLLEYQMEAREARRIANHAMEKALAFGALVKPGDPKEDADFATKKLVQATKLEGVARKAEETARRAARRIR